MKKIITIISILFICNFLSSCDDDKDEKEFEVNTSTMSQTVWSGSYVMYEGDNQGLITDVLFFFKSESLVEFSEYYNEGEYKNTVEYTIVGNILTFARNSISPQLSGDWLITEKSENRIVLKANLTSDGKYLKMTITRKNI